MSEENVLKNPAQSGLTIVFTINIIKIVQFIMKPIVPSILAVSVPFFLAEKPKNIPTTGINKGTNVIIGKPLRSVKKIINTELKKRIKTIASTILRIPNAVYFIIFLVIN